MEQEGIVMQISSDSKVMDGNDQLASALSDPVEFSFWMCAIGAKNKTLSRISLAALNLACVILGLRQTLLVDIRQIEEDIENHHSLNQALALLEFLLACGKTEAVSAGVSKALGKWPMDIRLIDLQQRSASYEKQQRFVLFPSAPKMRFGVLDFSYDGFNNFKNEFENKGTYSVNLGDFIQSEAVHHALISLGIEKNSINYVDRDSLNQYDGETLHLIMNGVFFPGNFPLSAAIKPIFFGMSFHPDNLLPSETKEDFENKASYLTANSIIGCRDEATAEQLGHLGFSTFVSGCLSQSLEQSGIERENLRTIVCGIHDEALLNQFREKDPQIVIFPDQRRTVMEYPLSEESRTDCRKAAGALIDFYRYHAGRVVTSLLHCAGPCAAMGIPTIVVRADPENIRFSTISKQLPVLNYDEALLLLDSNKVIESFAILDIREHQLDLLEAMIVYNFLSSEIATGIQSP